MNKRDYKCLQPTIVNSIIFLCAFILGVNRGLCSSNLSWVCVDINDSLMVLVKVNCHEMPYSGKVITQAAQLRPNTAINSHESNVILF